MDNDSEHYDSYRKVCAVNPLCPPESFIKAVSNYLIDVLFVNYNKAENCPYAIQFGQGYVCNCEERKEFYKKNGK